MIIWSHHGVSLWWFGLVMAIWYCYGQLGMVFRACPGCSVLSWLFGHHGCWSRHGASVSSWFFGLVDLIMVVGIVMVVRSCHGLSGSSWSFGLVMVVRSSWLFGLVMVGSHHDRLVSSWSFGVFVVVRSCHGCSVSLRSLGHLVSSWLFSLIMIGRSHHSRSVVMVFQSRHGGSVWFG